MEASPCTGMAYRPSGAAGSNSWLALRSNPPFMIQVLGGWVFLAHASGLPFRFWLRFTCAVADLGSLALLARLLRRRLSGPQARVALLWLSRWSRESSATAASQAPGALSLLALSFWRPRASPWLGDLCMRHDKIVSLCSWSLPLSGHVLVLDGTSSSSRPAS